MSRKVMMRQVSPIMLLVPLLMACGELTSGGVGDDEVWATADEQGTPSASPPPGSSAVVPPAYGWESHGTPSAASSRESAAAAGVLTAQLRVFLRSDLTGEWIEITDGVRDLTLDLDGSSERRVGVRILEGGRYTGLRIVFHRVEANVTGGLIVGGIPIVGLVSVDLGGLGTLTVERSLLLDLEAGGSQDVVLDMGASTWLPTLSLLTRIVAGAAFSNAIAVRVR
jgi:hypothetical protein